jgi:hypothetical protein
MNHITIGIRLLAIVMIGFVLTVTMKNQADAMSLFGGSSHSSQPTQTLTKNNGTTPTTTGGSNQNGLLSINANPVTVTPEPSTAMLLGSGLFGILLWRLKRNV